MKTFFQTYFLLSAVCCLSLSSCETAPQIEAGQLMPPSVDSAAGTEKTVRQDIVSVIKQISMGNINQFIDPEKGLWLIQSSGAMPNMTHTSQVDKNFPIDFSAVKEEELPKVDCAAKTFWTKEGCYLQQINSFKEEKIWTFCGLRKEDESKVEIAATAISLTVINTSLSTRYYFSLINEKWYLVFADLRHPCEA